MNEYKDPKDIKIGEDQSLADVMASHKKWVGDVVGGVRANLVRANLVRANLESANLVRANLESANLESANLYSANLYSANLVRANLVRANLESANLVSANLESANLVSANLESANLESANLESANLVRANLYSANLYSAKGLFLLGPIGSRGDFLYAVKHDKKIMIKAGCFWGTLAEFKDQVRKTHKENIHDQTYNAAIVLIRKYFKLVADVDDEEGGS